MVIVLLIGSFEAAKTIHGQVTCTQKSRLLMDKLDESGMGKSLRMGQEQRNHDSTNNHFIQTTWYIIVINRDIYSDPRIPECYNNKCQSIYIYNYIYVYIYIFIHSQCMVLLSLPISWNIIVINKNINNNNPLVIICQNVITESFFWIWSGHSYDKCQ